MPRGRIQGHDKQQMGKHKFYYSASAHFREKCRQTLRGSLPQLSELLGFCFLRGRGVPRLSILPTVLGLFITPESQFTTDESPAWKGNRERAK